MSANNQEQPVFDLEDVYDNEVSPLVKQIQAICENHGMPWVASFCFMSNETGVIGCCTSHHPHSNGWSPQKFKKANAMLLQGEVMP
jgi:hypothetical protein